MSVERLVSIPNTPLARGSLPNQYRSNNMQIIKIIKQLFCHRDINSLLLMTWSKFSGISYKLVWCYFKF